MNSADARTDPTDKATPEAASEVFGSEPTLTEPSEELVVEPIVPDCTAAGGTAQGSLESELLAEVELDGPQEDN